MATMSDVDFTNLCEKARDGETTIVLAAVDIDPSLATRADGHGYTLLICACEHDNPLLLVQGLLEKGANVHAQNSHGWDSLMTASQAGYVEVCTLLLNNGAHPDSNNEHFSALSLATHYNHLQVCLLLISRGANLMLALTQGTALTIYGNCKASRLTVYEFISLYDLAQRRAILQTAFERGPFMCWKRRWPMMNVMTGSGFRPLPDKLLLLQMHRIALSGKLPPIVLDSPEKRRTYFMGLIFSCDGLLRQIVAFL
jgi:hypothetical protein